MTDYVTDSVETLAKAECSCGHSIVMAHANRYDRCGHIGCQCRLSWAEALIASGAVRPADEEGLDSCTR